MTEKIKMILFLILIIIGVTFIYLVRSGYEVNFLDTLR